MLNRYIPKVGDLVDYQGIKMVIIYINPLDRLNIHLEYYLKEEILINDISSNVEEPEFLNNCIPITWNTCSSCKAEERPFTIIEKSKYEVKETILYSISKK